MSSQYAEGPTKAFPVSGALAQHLRVSFNGTVLALAGANELGVGTMEEPTFAGDTIGTVRLRNSGGTVKMVAAGAVTAGAPVYAAAGGKVASSGTFLLGQALEAASGDNSVIEVLRFGTSPGNVMHVRRRFTIAEVNAGTPLLAAMPNFRYRMVNCQAIAVGGAAGAVTSVNVIGTQSTAVNLVAFAQASLTQNTVLTAGGSGATVLAAGASYVANDVNTAITVGKSGSDITTATHIDILFSYVLEG